MKFRTAFGGMVCALAILLPLQTNASGIPVVDLTAIAKYVEQIAVLKNQLESAQRQFESLTGTRNLGDILNNPAIRASLPNDVRNLLGELESSSSSLSSSVNSILGKTRGPVDFSVDRKGLQERFEQLNATTQALGQQAYDGLQLRTQQVDALQAQINLTQDPKAIGELQARIGIEQSNIQLDKMRTELAQQQIASEKKILEDRASHIYKGWFDPANVPGNAAPNR